MTHAIGWFDVPCAEVERACRFYGAVLGKTLEVQSVPTGSGAAHQLVVLPHGDGEVSGCLTSMSPDGPRPGDAGPLLYFNCSGRLDDAIAAAQAHGGEVVKPKHPIGPYGWCAVVRDSEGNRIALWAPPA